MAKQSSCSWSTGHKALAIAVAFASGCVPSARLVTRLFTGRSIADMGTGQPGASNVKHSVGNKAAVVVAAMDMGKGFLPPLIGRVTGADAETVGLMAGAPILAHIAVVGGRGAAAALGAITAWDPVATSLAVAPTLVVGGLVKQHAPSVFVAASLWALVRWPLGRSRSQFLLGAATMGLLLAARLRAPVRNAGEFSAKVFWQRLIYDREAPPGEATPQAGAGADGPGPDRPREEVPGR